MKEVILIALFIINSFSFIIGSIKPIVEMPINVTPEEGFPFLLGETIFPITAYRFMAKNYNTIGSVLVAILSFTAWPGVLIGVLIDAIFLGGWFLFNFLFKKR